jgi:hypothetical protein
MTADDFREVIKWSAEQARKNEPTDVDQRARSFVALLSGSIKRGEPELRDAVWALLDIPEAKAPTPPPSVA